MTGLSREYNLVLQSQELFRCKVPLPGSSQLFVVNGLNQNDKKPIDIIFEKGKIAKDILQIISIRNSNNQFAIACPKNMPEPDTDKATTPLDVTNNFTFQKDSLGKMLLCFHTFTKDHFHTNDITNIRLESGAVADIVLMQNEHNNSTHHTTFNVELEANAELKLTFLSLHGGKIENTIKVNLNGERANVDIASLSLFDGNQVITNNLSITHNVPNCTSRQLFKSILDNNAVSHFSGKIHVVKDAQQTEAYQENHNLVLSDNVKVNTEPQLEIYADDVKCSHGATIGRLSDDELFYMRSRGISEKESKLLQQLAFAYTVIDKIENSLLKERTLSLVEKRLRGEFSDCKDCSKNCC